MIDGFNELYPNVEVTYNSAGDNNATVLSTAVQGGNPPDLGNFRRKVLGTDGFVIPTDAHGSPTGSGGRRALLYRRGPATVVQPPMARS